jgi:hypothetical protein
MFCRIYVAQPFFVGLEPPSSVTFMAVFHLEWTTLLLEKKFLTLWLATDRIVESALRHGKSSA